MFLCPFSSGNSSEVLISKYTKYYTPDRAEREAAQFGSKLSCISISGLCVKAHPDFSIQFSLETITESQTGLGWNEKVLNENPWKKFTGCHKHQVFREKYICIANPAAYLFG